MEVDDKVLAFALLADHFRTGRVPLAQQEWYVNWINEEPTAAAGMLMCRRDEPAGMFLNHNVPPASPLEIAILEAIERGAE